MEVRETRVDEIRGRQMQMRAQNAGRRNDEG
jgi:hypothetical protein